MKVIWMMNSKIRGVHKTSVPDYGKSVCWKSRGIALCTIFFSFFRQYGFFVTGQHDIILHSRQWLVDLPVVVPICTYTQPSVCNLACSKRSHCGYNTKRCEQKKTTRGWGRGVTWTSGTGDSACATILFDWPRLISNHPSKRQVSQSKHLLVGQV